MHISQERAKSFQSNFNKHYQENITEDEARLYLDRLVQFFLLLDEIDRKNRADNEIKDVVNQN